MNDHCLAARARIAKMQAGDRSSKVVTSTVVTSNDKESRNVLPMQVSVVKQTYDSFGGIAIHSLIGDLLTVQLGDYGSGVKEIDITVKLRHAERSPKPTLEDLFDEFHADLDAPPKISFRRTAKQIEIEFTSERFTAEDGGAHRSTLKDYQAAAEEIAALLPPLKRKIRSGDKFHVERFTIDAEKILFAKVRSVKEWKLLPRGAAAKTQAVETASPWDELDVDWNAHHRNARKILDEPFYWDCGDDDAPHGNDTGADLLAAFQQWHKQHPRTTPLKFFDALLQEWDIPAIDWLDTDRRRVRRQAETDPVAMHVGNQAAVALAFAALKMRAKCPPDVAERALAALDRMDTLTTRSKTDRQRKNAGKAARQLMRAKLQFLTPS